MRVLRRLFVAALFVGVLVLGWRFAADHAQQIVIRTPFSEWEVSLWLALLGAFSLGVITTGAIASFPMMRRGMLTRRYRKLIRDLESEVHQLRNLPLAAEDSPPDGGDLVSEAPGTGRALGRGA
jgi:hypothetical protein